jgi:hypothetical protein
MNSGEVDAILRRVALSCNKTVFNYLDGYLPIDKSILIRLMKLRDNLGRALLAGVNEETESQLWGEFEIEFAKYFDVNKKGS